MKTALALGILIVAGIVLAQKAKEEKQVRTEGPIASWVIPEAWSIAQGKSAGKPIVTRFNLALRSVIGHASFQKQLGIAVPFIRPTETGLPDSKESAAL